MEEFHITSINDFIYLLESNRVETVYIPLKLGSNTLRVKVEREELIAELRFKRSSDYFDNVIDTRYQLCGKELVAMDE